MSTAELVPAALDVELREVRQQIEAAHSVDVIREAIAQAEGWQSLLKSIGESQEKQNACAELKLRAIRRAGQLLTAKDAEGKFVTPDGMASWQASRYRTIGQAAEGFFESYIAESRRLGNDMTVSGLLRFLPKYGQTGTRYSDEVRGEVLRLAGAGKNSRQISELTGVSTASVKNWIADNRGTRPPSRRPKELRKKAAELRRSGDPLGEVEPHLRKMIAALQDAVDTAERGPEREIRGSLFPLAYRVEDGLRRVMQGKRAQ